MTNKIFRPHPLDRILQNNIPPGMHYAFVLNDLRVNAKGEPDYYEDVVEWCAENFAEQYPCEPRRWVADRRYFYRIFTRTETDAAAFKLRWC